MEFGKTKIKCLSCLKNGDLLASTYDKKIYIFKILDESYEKIIEYKIGNFILNAIELSNSKILTVTNDNKIYIYKYNKNLKKIYLESRITIKDNSDIFKVKLIDLKDSKNIMIVTNREIGYLNYKKNKYEFKLQNSWGFNIELLKDNLLIELNKGIYIRDRNSLEIKNFLKYEPIYNFFDFIVCPLKDGSILCGICDKFKIYLRQYIYENNELIELFKWSCFVEKKYFVFMNQLKNGNIIFSIESGSVYMLKI